MKHNSLELLDNLQSLSYQHRDQASALSETSIERLNHKNTPESWSALECIEHLNRYFRFYLPEIKSRLLSSQHASHSTFQSSWLGNYFAELMKPKPGFKKMSTLKSMNPTGSKLNKDCLKEFIRHLNTLIQLLEHAKQVDLNRTKTSISISRLIKLRLGDTFQVVCYHNDRHLKQAMTAIDQSLSIGQNHTLRKYA